MLESIIGEVRGVFSRVTLAEMAISILCILTGILFYSNINSSNATVSWVVGIIFILNGLISIYSYLKKEDIVLYDNNMIFGILLIITGILIIILRNILRIILAVYVLFVGLQRINYGLVLKRFQESSWFITSVIGILLVILAIITFFTKSDALVEVAAIHMFGMGVIILTNTILLRRRSKYFLE